MAERAGAWAARWQRLWPWGLFIALVLVALGPALASGPLWSSRYDWRYFETMTEMARRTVADYHQAPLWNPYSCGGEVGLANPQAMDGAPTFLLVLLLGTAWRRAAVISSAVATRKSELRTKSWTRSRPPHWSTRKRRCRSWRTALSSCGGARCCAMARSRSWRRASGDSSASVRSSEPARATAP